MKNKNINQLIFLIIIISVVSACSFTGNIVDWVKIDSGDFLLYGKKTKFIGANAVNLVFYDELGLDRKLVFKTAKNNKIKVLRIFFDWGYGSQNDYDEIVDLASRYNIYLIVTLTDCCCSSDYLDIDNYFKKHAFYCNISNPEAIEAFKKRIREIIMHKNFINGRLYRDEPAIFAWDIANELEFWHFDISEVKKWISEIANYIKQLDPNHLVTITIGTSSNNFDYDDLLYKIFDVSELDYLSFSFYSFSKEFNGNYPSDLKERIYLRIKKMLPYGKPILLQEFGFSTSGKINFHTRNSPKTISLYYKVLKDIMDTAFSSGAKGVLFWGWGLYEEKKAPFWWSEESHSAREKEFCRFLKNYRIPQ